MNKTKMILKSFLPDRAVRRLLWTALILSCLLATWDRLTSYVDDLAMYLEMSIKTPESGNGTLFYDIGKQYNPDHVSSAFMVGDGQYQEVRFKLPVFYMIYHLRFDPPSVKKGEIAINRLELVDHYGRVLQRFDLNGLRPLNQIGQFTHQNGEVRFTVDETANDPYMDLGLKRPISVNRYQFVRMLVNGILLEWMVLFFICIFLIFVWSRFRDKTIATLVVLAILPAGWFLYEDAVESYRAASSYFKVTMMSDARGGIAKLYYDLGESINEADASALEILPGKDIRTDSAFREYRFKIPGRFFQLRFDPLDIPGAVTIRKIEITDPYGKLLHTVPFDRLRPNADIRTFEKRGQELVVTMEKAVGDPQIDILNAERLSPPLSDTFPIWDFLRRVLFKWAVIVSLLFIAVLIRRRYTGSIHQFLDGTFFQRKMHLIYLGCTLGLILAMAVVSHPQGNPDELGHEVCAAYFANHWLPPAVDDPAVIKTLSGYGVSYLFRTEIVYFLAGKTAVLLSELIHESYLGLRLFNVFLFGLLMTVAIRRTQEPLLFVLGLVATPQVWYIFSYFNGDAFPLFLALLIAVQVMYSNTISSRYFDSPTLRDRISGGVLLGILLGLMLLSKQNYHIYLAFIALILVLRLFFESRSGSAGRWPLQMKKGILIAGVALSIYLPYIVYDQYINGFQKQERIDRIAEQKALYPFKGSTIKNKPSESYPGLALRDKGVTFRKLFLENDEWRQMSFKSFFGVYGFMIYYAKKYHYQTITILLAAAFLFILFYTVYHSPPWRDSLVLLLALFFSLLVIGASVYFSWVADYEPQGRYLFPIIPILLVGTARLPELMRKRFIPCFSFCLFLFSLLSFVFAALPYLPKVS